MNLPNPYDPPSPPNEDQTDAITSGRVRYEVFRQPYAFFVSTHKHMQSLRAKAQDFINTTVGAENVISVAESKVYSYHVTVWYRDP